MTRRRTPSCARRTSSPARRTRQSRSVIVVVLAVNGVAVSIVRVVHVVAVRNSHVATPLTVHMLVVGVGKVVSRLALVEMPVVPPVEVTVVRVVHVVTVRNGHVAASFTVRVAVVGVLEVCRGHQRLPFRCPGA